MNSPLQSQKQDAGLPDKSVGTPTHRGKALPAAGRRGATSQKRALKKAAATWRKKEGTARRGGCPYKVGAGAKQWAGRMAGILIP